MRRLFKWTLVVALLVVAVSAALVGLVLSPPGHAMIAAVARAAVPNLRLGGLTLGLDAGWLVLALDAPELVDEDGVRCFGAARVSAAVSLGELTGGRIVARELRVAQAAVSIHTTSSGAQGFATVVPRSDAAPAEDDAAGGVPWIEARDVWLSDVQLVVRDTVFAPATVAVALNDVWLDGWTADTALSAQLDLRGAVELPGRAPMPLRAAAEAEWVDDRLTAQLGIEHDAARVDASVVLALPTRDAFAALHVRGLALAPFGVDATVHTRGTLASRGQPLAPDWSLATKLDLSGSRYAEHQFSRARVDAEVGGERWRLHGLRLQSGALSFDGSGAGTIIAGAPYGSLAVDATAAGTLPIPGVAATVAMARLHGTVASQREQGRRTLAASLQLLAETARLQTTALRAGADSARLTLDYSDDGALADGSAVIAVRGARSPALADVLADLRLTLGRRGAMVTAEVSATLGRKQDAATLRGAATFDLGRASGVSDIAWAERPLTLRPTTLTADLGKLTPQLALAEVHGLTGQVELVAEGGGSLSSPKAAVRARLRDLTLQGSPALDAELVFGLDEVLVVEAQVVAPAQDTGAPGPLTLLQVSAEAPRGLLFGEPLIDAQVDITAQGKRLSLPLLQRLFGRMLGVRASLGGTVSFAAELTGSMGAPRITANTTIEELQVGAWRWPRVSAGLSATGDERRTHLSASAELDGQRLLELDAGLAARWDKLRGDSRLDAKGALLVVPLARLMPSLSALPAPLAASVAATFSADGSLAAPRLDAAVALTDIRVADVALGALAARARYGEGALRLDTQGVHDTQWLRGNARYSLRSERIDADVSLHELPLALATAVAPQGKFDGTLSASAQVSGPVAAPGFDAKLTVKDGAVRYADLPPFTGIALTASLTPQALRVESLRANGVRGAVEANATLSLRELRPESLRARVAAKQLEFSYSVLQSAVLSAAVDVDLAFTSLGTRGVVTVSEGALNVPALGEAERSVQQVGGLKDVTFVELGPDEQLRDAELPALTQAPEAPADAVDVALHADPFVLRSERTVLEIVSELRLRTAFGRLTPDGRVFVRRGQVEVLSQLYEVERASAAFALSREIDPALDVLLQRQFPNVKLSLGVRGTASAPELVLSGSPGGYDRSQLLALVLTGRDSVSGAGSATGDAVASAAVGALLGPLTSKLGRKVGLDVVRLGFGGRQGKNKTALGGTRATLELGKYLTDRLYVAGRGVLGAGEGENAYEARLEYRLSDRLFLESAFGDRGIGGLDLVWRYLY